MGDGVEERENKGLGERVVEGEAVGGDNVPLELVDFDASGEVLRRGE